MLEFCCKDEITLHPFGFNQFLQENTLTYLADEQGTERNNFMKKSDLYAAYKQHAGTLSVENVKKVHACIIKFIIHLAFIFVYCGTFYLKNKNCISVLNDRDVATLIRYLLDPVSRVNVSSACIDEVIERLRDMPEIQIDIDAIIEKNQYRVLCKNGVYDLKTKKFDSSPPDSELFTYRLNFNYIENADIKKADSFMYFVDTSLGEENIECTLESMGYCCTLQTKARTAILFIGPERSGKSLLLDVEEDGFGEENVSAVSFAKIGTEQSRIKYQGKIVNISREIPAESLKNDDAFKSLIAGEKITGRNLYENSKEFKVNTKFVAASNFFPDFKHLDTAIIDRITPIYFKDRVSNNIETDYGLKEKILAEKDIIFSAALDRAADLIANNYQFSLSDRAKNVLESKRRELLNVNGFLDEYFEIDGETTISSAELHRVYVDWCSVNAVTPDGRNTFYSKVTDYSNKISRGKFPFGKSNLNGFKGLRYKCQYGKEMYGQLYQDSPVSTQKGGEGK